MDLVDALSESLREIRYWDGHPYAGGLGAKQPAASNFGLQSGDRGYETVPSLLATWGDLLGQAISELKRYETALKRMADNRCPLCGPNAADQDSEWCGRYEHDACIAIYAREVLRGEREPA